MRLERRQTGVFGSDEIEKMKSYGIRKKKANDNNTGH